ncbi:MAG: ABC transporter ATP-binding protein [Anaerolineales bacterium]
MENQVPIIETSQLRREFKKTVALDSLDLTVKRGELFGLIGPDGAGKTTALRLLAGLLSITSGSASAAGCDLKENPECIKSKIGYMAQQFSLYGGLSVHENLVFFADLYDVDMELIPERMARLLRFAGLVEFQDRRAANLSGGMQKKLALACTLIHQPEILLLDEPTTGVDPISRREFWDILTDLHLDGTTIMVSTPYMDEADRCSRVGLMYAGRMVVCDSPLRIRAQIEGELIEITPDDWRAAKAFLSSQAGVLEIQTYGEKLHVLVDSASERLPQFRESLDREGLGYHSIRSAPPSMEQAFVSLIRKIEA